MNIPFDVTGKKFESKRLIFRPFEEKDLNDFYEYSSVPGIQETAGRRSHDSIDVSKHALSKLMERKNTFAIVLKENGKVIGTLCFHGSWSSSNESYKHLKAKELGCVISTEYQGRGMATEVAFAAIDYGFNTIGLDAVAIAHISENAASKKIAEKCGFKYIETGVYHSKELGKTFDDIRHILIRDSL